MSWEYRVIRKFHDGITGMGGHYYEEETFGIHEVYYHEDDETKIYAVSEDPIAPHGLSLDELTKDYALMARALTKPVLDYEDIEFYDRDETPLSELLGKKDA